MLIFVCLFFRSSVLSESDKLNICLKCFQLLSLQTSNSTNLTNHADAPVDGPVEDPDDGLLEDPVENPADDPVNGLFKDHVCDPLDPLNLILYNATSMDTRDSSVNHSILYTPFSSYTRHQ
jgi:hypothetical protein